MTSPPCWPMRTCKNLPWKPRSCAGVFHACGTCADRTPRQAGTLNHGECGGGRRPVGRRRQGQDRRLAVEPGRCRGRGSRGGHNAGHTLVIDGSSTSSRCCLRASCGRASSRSSATASSSTPGISSRRSPGCAAQGVAISPENLRVADNATLILPLHRELDHFRETANAGLKIGTTKRGIGPAYEDKVGRRAIRIIDLKDPGDPGGQDRAAARRSQCAEARARHRRGRRRRTAGAADRDRRRGPALRRHGLGAARSERRAGRRILFEGAQGALLDVDHGTYPFVTSSNIVAGQAATARGWGLRRSATFSASPRPIRPGSAKARSRCELHRRRDRAG